MHVDHSVAASAFLLTDPPPPQIYTLSLHDALPISGQPCPPAVRCPEGRPTDSESGGRLPDPDRKSTRLNSSHRCISYAVFCLKKKKYITQTKHRSDLRSAARLAARICVMVSFCIVV